MIVRLLTVWHLANRTPTAILYLVHIRHIKRLCFQTAGHTHTLSASTQAQALVCLNFQTDRLRIASPPPALYSDQYRSRSMARLGGPPLYPHPQSFQQGSASAFRQQPYNATRTTAQGRQIPERQDERAMTMGTFSVERDTQLTSGRIVPGRRRESNSDPFADPTFPKGSMDSRSSPAIMHTRRPSDGLIPGRSVSGASVVSDSTTLVNERSDSTNGRPGRYLIHLAPLRVPP